MKEKVQVKVTRLAFHGGQRVRPGAVITVDRELFTETWMEPVGWKPDAKPEAKPKSETKK